MDENLTQTKTKQGDGIGSFDGKPDTATIADTDPLNTLGNPSQVTGQASGDGERMEYAPRVPSTTHPAGTLGKRLTRLSGMLKAINVDGILYVGDYANIEIKVTFQSGGRDSKIIDVGDMREASVAIVLLNDNPLDAHGSFFDVEP